MARGVLTTEELAQYLDRTGRQREPAQSPKVLPMSRGARARAHRFETVNAFVDVALRDLNGAEAKVWLVLWRDTRHGTACVSNKELGLRAGHDERTVRRVVRSLVRSGWLEVVKRGGIGRGASVYRVRVGREVNEK